MNIKYTIFFFLLVPILSHAQLNAGLGYELDYVDFNPGISAIAQYELHENYSAELNMQMKLKLANQINLNLNLLADVFTIAEKVECRFKTGLNVFPARGAKLQGERIRGPVLYGLNLGFGFYTTLKKINGFIDLKYTHHKNIRNIHAGAGLLMSFELFKSKS